MRSLVALTPTGSKCIKNKQSLFNKFSSLYMRFAETLQGSTTLHLSGFIAKTRLSYIMTFIVLTSEIPVSTALVNFSNGSVLSGINLVGLLSQFKLCIQLKKETEFASRT